MIKYTLSAMSLGLEKLFNKTTQLFLKAFHDSVRKLDLLTEHLQ